MKINFIFLLGCMIACLLFLSCSVGDKSNSQVTEASALTSNVQENKSEQETKTAKEANSVQGNLGLELSQTHFTNKPQVVMVEISLFYISYIFIYCTSAGCIEKLFWCVLCII